MKVSQFQKLTQADKRLALIDFYADWCAPCQTMNPILQQLSRDYSKYISLVKVNVDKSRPVAEKFNVKSIPTLVLLNNNKIIWRKSGLVRKSEIKTVIDKSIK
jgi:thioredoxin 1